jgi:ubiquinol-cytochrome c reductase iron-sulfur subunit
MPTFSPPDTGRRHLVITTTVICGTGLAATAVPFVASLSPSERARAQGAPDEFDVQALQSDELKTIEWRGKPVFILRCSLAMLASLTRHDDLLADPLSRRSEQPNFAMNPERSTKPEFLVLVGLCTHLGCIPSFRPNPEALDLGASWPGGFYCPCHGSKFDLAGRVFKNVPAPTNLTVPPHHFVSRSMLLIGAGPGA